MFYNLFIKKVIKLITIKSRTFKIIRKINLKKKNRDSITSKSTYCKRVIFCEKPCTYIYENGLTLVCIRTATLCVYIRAYCTHVICVPWRTTVCYFFKCLVSFLTFLLNFFSVSLFFLYTLVTIEIIILFTPTYSQPIMTISGNLKTFSYKNTQSNNCINIMRLLVAVKF